jgi:rhamnosyltransferase
MVYHRLRRAVLAPFAAVGWAAIRFGARSLELLKKWLGLLYLIGWVATAWIAAFGRGFRRAGTGRSTAPVEPLASGSLGRRPRILVVSPYQLHPADHGGGVRIFNLVRQLSRHCDLQLLIFSPRDDDPQQREVLAPLVEKVYFHHWRPGFKPDPWGLKPKGVQLFEAGEVRAKVVEILARERIDILQLEYTEMGQYGLPRFARVKVVLTEIDITFRARARRRRAGMHRRYVLDQIFGTSWTDSLRQLRYELQVARRADQVHVMSQTDGDYLARFLPSGWRTLRVIPNAVDGGYYLPSAPGQRLTRRLLFLGNFDHLPNLDALDYLLERIWPRVRERVPDASLWVVGARADSVRHYDGREGVVVVGAVPETKPFYQQCRALLAPIRAGSGTRLKILEALACATPVVTTTVGAEGIAGAPGEHFLIADDEASFAELTCRVLTDGELCARLGRAGRQLIETGYSWERSSAVALAAYQELCPQTASAPIRDRRAAPPVEKSTARRKQVDVSVIIPTLNGGVLLERCLAAVRRQRTARSVEIFCVDSGSPRADLAVMKRYDANVHPIDRSEFNHGLTRDLGASRSRGRALVFLSQDAVPRDDEWLERLVAPLFDNGSWAAVQGAIAEVPDPRRRFYWASCGARFYFTRESKRWIESYFGIGFSTVNAAIRRDVWQQHPFGPAAIMEDKKWQRDVVAAGLTIVEAPEAVVHHTHDYSLRSLLNRCYSEGIGWREAGERYSLGDMLADLWQPGMAVDLLRGFRAREVRSWAEVLFPWLRPVMLFRGSQWGRSVRL